MCYPLVKTTRLVFIFLAMLKEAQMVSMKNVTFPSQSRLLQPNPWENRLMGTRLHRQTAAESYSDAVNRLLENYDEVDLELYVRNARQHQGE
jgi:hypothetical protein